MKIKNKRNQANCVNYKLGGFSKKTSIPSGKTVDVIEITNVLQILNYGDFNRGFFEIIYEKPETTESKENLEEDYLDKVKKEVKDYTEKK